jgi:hypothetical protein
MHALPVELLERIFTFCTEAPENPFLPNPVWLPITITHVCHHWRTIALSHGPLWTSITRGLSLHGIKAFMERSRSGLMDFDIHVGPSRLDTRTGLRQYDIIQLFTHFTRVRSLGLTGDCLAIRPIVSSFRSSLPVQSLSLCIEQISQNYILPDNLFGGKAPIRRLQLIGNGQIVVPHWLLRGVTHFTTSEIITLPNLLEVLCHMSALAYFEFRGRLNYREASPIQMPQLTNLTVRAYSPKEFTRLNQLLVLQVGAKKRMELPAALFQTSFFDRHGINDLLFLVGIADGFQHIHFSGGQKEGWFRLWTGNAVTTWEDAEFCLHVEWREPGLSRENLRYFMAFCGVLGAARVCRLVIDSPSGLQKPYWSLILHKLPGIEEVELSPASVDMWKGIGAPTMLPALRRVRVIDSVLDHYRPSAPYLWHPPSLVG